VSTQEPTFANLAGEMARPDWTMARDMCRGGFTRVPEAERKEG